MTSEIVRLKRSEQTEIPPEMAMEPTWLTEEYIRKQALFRTDLVADGNGSIYHVEQQTDHKRMTMLRRLAEYASLNSSFYDFERKLYQIYSYPGESRVRW